MTIFKRKNDSENENNLIEEIYRRQTSEEISEIELAAERIEAYEKMRARKRMRGFSRALAVGAFMFVMTAAALYVGYRLMFIIRDVEVVGDSPYSYEEICESSGVVAGRALFSFSSKTAEDMLRRELPFIGTLEVDRHIPNRVTLTVKSEAPAYYVDIYGKIYILSDSLRILGEADDSDTGALVRLLLPGVSEATAGQVINLRDPLAGKMLTSVCKAVAESDMSGRINCIDLRDIYNPSMVCDGKYLLIFGASEEIDLRLRIAEAVLADEMFHNQNKARVDLTNLSETIVVVDNQLDLYG